MKKNLNNAVIIDSVEAHHNLLQIEKPLHPLISVIDFSKADYSYPVEVTTIVSNLYSISMKEGAACVMRYGPHYYDFSQGVMSFFKPGQIFTLDPTSPKVEAGFTINVHPDFIRSYPLTQKMKGYNFFDYEVNEALFVSDREKLQLHSIFEGIMLEYQSNIDSFSQDAIVALLDVLLVYANRYYNRQFITRKIHSEPLVVKFEKLMETYFSSGKLLVSGLPHVKYFAEQLHMSSNYLSDLLRVATGHSAQSHIQNRIVEEAKTLLTTSNLRVAEIAYQLGFEQPQSLHRLFKKKTDMSPVQFRQSFN